MANIWTKLFFDWEFVRAFGELQILTRVSYTMLILVPVLAALWPTIAEMLRYYELLFSANGIIPSETSPTASDSDIKLLPNAWAIAFSGSLSAALAHLTYQVWAPEIARKFSKEQFLDAQVRRYNENPTKSQLRRAIHILKVLLRKNTQKKSEDIQKLLQRWKQTFLIDDEKANIKAHRDASESFDPFEPVPTEMDERQRKIAGEIVSVAAELEYRLAARKNYLFACLACFLYIVATVAISWITVTQAFRVFAQAGWISP